MYVSIYVYGCIRIYPYTYIDTYLQWLKRPCGWGCRWGLPLPEILKSQKFSKVRKSQKAVPWYVYCIEFLSFCLLLASRLEIRSPSSFSKFSKALPTRHYIAKILGHRLLRISASRRHRAWKSEAPARRCSARLCTLGTYGTY